ncbi:hypothetical protein DH2020_028692 [Rehmannia glutinosa]|uniref:DUF4378 domain-containing protein n=1 Tax=Rehmannia glutinosa TaxID=99300 RepID=A0ABR0VRK0_REHGL
MDSSLIRQPIRALPKPLLLKDHLLDDMSSCSSNGFKSFPRRQCCTSVRFLHEFEYRNKNKQQRQQQKRYSDFNRTASKSAISAIQSVITAVKRLPFAAAKSAEKRRFKDSFLARSFSRKILKKSGFWKRKPEQKEIGRWKSFDQLLKEDAEPSARSDGWSGSDFTASDDCSSGNSSSEVNSNLPEERNDVVQVPVKVVSSGNGVGVTTNGDVSTVSTTECSANTNSSTNSQQKQWSSEEKEQFSPVSVLDCPFDDEDEVSSAFQHRLARMEGAKMKLMKKIQRERVSDESSFDEGLLEEADDWINGRKSRELFVEWEVQGNRKAYIKDMEKGGEWKTLEQESDEVALELETVVFDELLNEVLLEISS